MHGGEKTYCGFANEKTANQLPVIIIAYMKRNKNRTEHYQHLYMDGLANRFFIFILD